MERTSRILSYLLIFGGAVLLFLGAREVWESHAGQIAAAGQFDSSADNGSAAPAPQGPQLGDAVAKLSIPRLDTQLYVVEGDGAQQLRRGPGHLIGSAMPGSAGNCVIAGHRDTHFRILKDIRKGDDIVIETRNGEYLYRVKNTRVVSPKDTEPLQPTTDAELHLVTCYPFYYVGSAPKRFVVQADLVGAVNATQTSAENSSAGARSGS